MGLRTMRTRLGPGKLQHRLCPEWPSDTPGLHACPPPPGLQIVFMWQSPGTGDSQISENQDVSVEKTMAGMKGIYIFREHSAEVGGQLCTLNPAGLPAGGSV